MFAARPSIRANSSAQAHFIGCWTRDLIDHGEPEGRVCLAVFSRAGVCADDDAVFAAMFCTV